MHRCVTYACTEYGIQLLAEHPMTVGTQPDRSVHGTPASHVGIFQSMQRVAVPVLTLLIMSITHLSPVPAGGHMPGPSLTLWHHGA